MANKKGVRCSPYPQVIYNPVKELTFQLGLVAQCSLIRSGSLECHPSRRQLMEGYMQGCPGCEYQGGLKFNMRAADQESQKIFFSALLCPPIPSSAVKLCHLQPSKAFGKNSTLCDRPILFSPYFSIICPPNPVILVPS